MPGRPTALFVLAVVFADVGCTRYAARRKPPARPPLPSPYDTTAAAPTARTPLAINTAPAGPPASPGGDLPLVPLPPGPRGTPDDVVVRPPTAPGTADTGIVPASVAALPPVSSPPSTLPPGPPPSPFARSATPTAPPAGENNFANVKRLAGAAARKWDATDDYHVHFVRRDAVPGRDMTATEEIEMDVRKAPFGVYMKYVGEAARNREVVFAPKPYGDDLIHVVVGEKENVPFFRAGQIAPALSPESPMVRGRTRHSIRDAGFGSSVGKFTTLVTAVEAGKRPADTLRHGGAVTHVALPGATLELVEQTIAAKEEPLLPKGGKRFWYFDAKPGSPSFGLPMLVITTEAGREVEFYVFSQFKPSIGLTDAAFRPERLKERR